MKDLSDVQMTSVECGMKVDCAFALAGLGVALIGLSIATAGIAAGGVIVATADAIGFGTSFLGGGLAAKDVFLGCF